jgi:hypothetical protein
MQIAITLPDNFDSMFEKFASSLFPNLVRNMEIATDKVVMKWKTLVNESSAKSGWKSKYADAITKKQISALEYEVSAESMFANFVENGVKSFDMKKGLLSGPKARPGKNGPYTIVYFRHFTPGADQPEDQRMDQKTYEGAKALDQGSSSLRYRVTGLGQRIKTIGSMSGLSEPLVARKHSSAASMKEASGGSGIMKMGSKGHTQYGSFVTVTKKSKGWKYPAVPAVPIFEPMVSEIGPKVKRYLQDALIEDLAAVDLGGV